MPRDPNEWVLNEAEARAEISRPSVARTAPDAATEDRLRDLDLEVAQKVTMLPHAGWYIRPSSYVNAWRVAGPTRW